jgi:hypothetical protein
MMRDEIVDAADSARASRSGNVRVKFTKANRRTKRAFFSAHDTKGSGKKYEITVDLSEHKGLQKDMNQHEAVQLAVEAGDIKTHCNCPDFLYGGFKYMADELSYGTRTEKRFPGINNPDLEGSVCKHTLAVLEGLNGYVDKIAKAFSWRKK